MTSHKFTRLFFALAALIVLAASALAGNPPAIIGVSDQKAGSLLVFPYYTSLGTSDTRLTISNTGNESANIHMFFIGADCNQADQYICLTANASASFLASEYDPSNSGYLLAVAVDDRGRPVQNNVLIGNTFLNDGNYVGNYGAEAFWSGRSPAKIADDKMSATLMFDDGNKGYDFLPTQHVAEIQSPNDSVGQRIIVAGLDGNLITNSGLSTASAQAGIGVAYNDGEKPGSYSNPFGGACLKSFIIDAKTPRVPGGLGSQAGINNNALIPAGRTGTLKWNTGGSVGLILTPKTGANKWSGIRTLHKTAVRTNGSLVIPVFDAPNCVGYKDMEDRP
jgi:hypothetical protein